MAALGWILATVASVVAVAVLIEGRRRLNLARVELEAAVSRAETTRDDSLRRAERLRRALDAIPEGVVVANAEGEVVHRNAVAATVRGGRHGEALVDAAIEELLGAAASGQPVTRNLELYGPPHRVLEISATPLNGGGVVVVDDVTERRRVDAVRRDFVANISHELKTPVGAIGLLAETLLSESDPVVIERLAGRMVDESFRVGRTIDDLLELSRIESLSQPIRESVPVARVLAEAVDRLRPAAGMAGISITVTEPSRRLTVVGDRRQLVSALSNLIDNAVKYSDPGSEVSLRARGDGSRVEIDVVDRGLGIPPRDIERIFERFYRVDRARSRETGGTGLGLSIVRHVVANHEGAVRVRSCEGEGSTFTLDLPAGTGPVAVSEPADEDPEADPQAEAG